VLGPQTVREIVVHVLESEKGDALRALAASSGRFARIASILRRIQEDHAAELDVTSPACEANMSVSTFHQAFREMTATSSLQYLKQTRLHRARALLVDQGVTAQEAARRVGYARASQFGREYGRTFGVSPASDRAARRPGEPIELTRRGRASVSSVAPRYPLHSRRQADSCSCYHCWRSPRARGSSPPSALSTLDWRIERSPSGSR
jgi:AraC-like DNA-binding protein